MSPYGYAAQVAVGRNMLFIDDAARLAPHDGTHKQQRSNNNNKIVPSASRIGFKNVAQASELYRRKYTVRRTSP